MIKFFRHIRQRMIKENRFSKYLLYAIGEIILVVIGILIALYLNKKQQEHTIQKQQENYLIQIKGEMVNNLKSLSAEKEELSGTLNNAYKILNIMNNDSLIDNLTEPDLSQLMYAVLSEDIIFFNENGALNQIIYSGGLKEIRNDSISGLLASWEGKVNRVRSQEEQVAEATDYLKNYLTQYGDFRSFIDDMGFSKAIGIDLAQRKQGNKNLLRSKEFENYMFRFVAGGNPLQLDAYPKFEKEIQSLIKLIDQELKDKK